MSLKEFLSYGDGRWYGIGYGYGYGDGREDGAGYGYGYGDGDGYQEQDLEKAGATVCG